MTVFGPPHSQATRATTTRQSSLPSGRTWSTPSTPGSSRYYGVEWMNYVQGDNSACSKPPVDFDVKVAF